MNDQIDQLEHHMWAPITPTTEAEKIVAALKTLNRALPEPTHATTPLKVSWLLQTPISPFQLFLSSTSSFILPSDRLHVAFLRFSAR